MPIDLVIDERDGTSKPDLGDTNNNSGAHHASASTADTSHTDGSYKIVIVVVVWQPPPDRPLFFLPVPPSATRQPPLISISDRKLLLRAHISFDLNDLVGWRIAEETFSCDLGGKIPRNEEKWVVLFALITSVNNRKSQVGWQVGYYTTTEE